MAEKLRLDIYPSVELRKALDRWRIEQPDAPSRAEAARRLIERSLNEEAHNAIRTSWDHWASRESKE